MGHSLRTSQGVDAQRFELVGSGDAGAAGPIGLHVLPDPFGIQVRRVGRDPEQGEHAAGGGGEADTDFALCTGCPSRINNTGPPASWSSRLPKSMNFCAVRVPSMIEKRSAPLAVTAEIMFTENRAPVLETTGV